MKRLSMAGSICLISVWFEGQGKGRGKWVGKRKWNVGKSVPGPSRKDRENNECDLISGVPTIILKISIMKRKF